MKLRNKKTGEIVDDGYVRETHDFQFDGQKHILAVFKGNGHRPPERVSGAYKTLAELNEEWEDYEEPKEYWFINSCGAVEAHTEEEQLAVADMHKQFGNYFETEEEAEKAVEKLEAWKRLKDKGFRFGDYDVAHDKDRCFCGQVFFKGGPFWFDIKTDLDLLFGGEE